MIVVAASVVTAFIVAIVPWMLVAGRRLGHLLAGVAVFAADVVIVTAALVVSRWFRGDVVVVVVTVELLVAVAGLFALRRWGGGRLSRSALATWLPALVGGALWTSAVAVAPLVQGGAQLAWALSGDGSNNLGNARDIRQGGGIAVGPGAIPVPYPAAIVALCGLPLEGAGATAEGFRSQVVALTISWVLALVAWCLMSGVATASLVPRERIGLTTIVSALGSLLPLTALMGGLPMLWGYLNVNVAVALTLMVWCAALGSRRHPVVAVATQLLLAIVIVLTWSPLVTIPLTAAAVLALRDGRWRALTRNPGRWVLLGGAALLAIVGSIFVLPVVQRQTDFAIPGHGFPSTWWLLIAVGAFVALLAAWVGPRIRSDVRVIGLTMVGGTALAVGGTLYLSLIQAGEPLTSYYSIKVSWLSTVLLAIVGVALVVGALSRLARFAHVASAAAVIAVLIVAEFAVPVTVRTGSDPRPLAMVLGGGAWNTGDAAVEKIIRLSNDETPGILWRSGDPDEGVIDYWALENQGGRQDPEVRRVSFLAYRGQRDRGGFDGADDAVLCGVLARLPHLEVYTADPELVTRLGRECPDVDAAALVRLLPA